MRFTTVCRAELPRHATVRFRGGSGGRERAVADLDKVIDVRRCLEKQQRIDALSCALPQCAALRIERRMALVCSQSACCHVHLLFWKGSIISCCSRGSLS
jgi:hypothetical protein